MNTREQIYKALQKVEDPDLKKDLVSLNMVKKVEVKNKHISIEIVLTTPACPLKEFIKGKIIDAVTEEIGNDYELEIEMGSSVVGGAPSAMLTSCKNIIAIASGKGGVGKSTVTANLAICLARTGAKVGLIDADIFGPSIPTLFHCEYEQPGIIQKNGKNMIVPIEQYGIKLISIGFLSSPENAVVWRGPMASSALKQFFGDTDWGELDYLFIDLPPGTSDIHITLVQTVSVTGAVIVTTPQKVAITDANKAVAMFQQPQIQVPILGIIENMAYFTPQELPDNKYYIFGKNGGKQLAEKHKIPFLGEIPLVQSLRESADSGYPLSMKEGFISDCFMEIAKKIAQNISIKNTTHNKYKP